MNLPSGVAMKTGIDVVTLDFPALMKELIRKKFSGYACVTIQGGGGIEEGTVIFNAGKPTAAVYEYLRYNKPIFAKDAVPRIFNAAAATYGVVDIYQLTPEQVQLILAFNENAVLPTVLTERDIDGAATTNFSEKFEEELEVSREGPKKVEKLLSLMEKIRGKGSRLTEISLSGGEESSEEEVEIEKTKGTKKKVKKKR